jgi:hypothetical protein
MGAMGFMGFASYCEPVPRSSSSMNVGFCPVVPARGAGLELLAEANPQSPPGQFEQPGAHETQELQGEQHEGTE